MHWHITIGCSQHVQKIKLKSSYGNSCIKYFTTDETWLWTCNYWSRSNARLFWFQEPTQQNNELIWNLQTAQNSILHLLNFLLQNLSNLDAAIQIFLCPHKPNSLISHFLLHISPHWCSLNICYVTQWSLFTGFCPVCIW